MKKDNTLAEMLAGILAIGVLLQILLFIFFEKHLYHAIGLWSGIAIVVFFLIHMKRSIEDALDFEEERAKKYAGKQYAVRMLVSAVIIGAVLYFKVGNPVTILCGVSTLKLAAFIQPWVHKLFLKQKKGG